LKFLGGPGVIKKCGNAREIRFFQRVWTGKESKHLEQNSCNTGKKRNYKKKKRLRKEMQASSEHIDTRRLMEGATQP